MTSTVLHYLAENYNHFMKKALLLVVCFFTSMAWAQDFETQLSDANNLYAAQEYEASGKQYDQAFELQKGTASQYYNAACSWALAGNSEKAIEYLGLSARQGWSNVNHMKTDGDLQSLHEDPEWENIIKQVDENKAELEKDFNKPLMKELEDIYVKDQMLRQLYRDAEEKFGADSPEMNYFWTLVSQQDSANEFDVERIIQENGWVGKSEVGGKANMTLWLVIQHAPIETQEKYLPLLQESVKKGESSGSHLALLEDRILMRNNKPQTYGSQIITNPETGEQEVYEIADPEYVDQRRREVGLAPISTYLKRWNISWDIPQKDQ